MQWKFWESSTGSMAGSDVAGTVLRIAGGALAVYVVVVLALAWWWDYEPGPFDVVEYARETHPTGGRLITGEITTATMIGLGRTILEKRGGYLSNDVFPPGVWMDNTPNWEFGVLVQIRDMSRALRIDLSRSQSQSAEDPDLSEAEGKFFWDNSSWIFPNTQNEYEEGIDYLESYRARLVDPGQTGAQFFARADNLRNWLTGVETRLGSLSQRLSASVGKRQLNVDLAGDAAAERATAVPEDTELKTSWFEIDDIFYEARGQAWALIHLLRAVEHDFGAVLDDKNARVSLEQIIRELEATQDTVWSPFILNGSGFGLVANHSLVMASYISRANAAIIDLRSLLAQG